LEQKIPTGWNEKRSNRKPRAELLQKERQVIKMSRKNALIRFIFSLIPGAGEMYMGFMKQGITLMALFMGVIFLATYLKTPIFVFALPVIWFYGFFHVHNLAGLSDEEFYAQEDSLFFDWNIFGQLEQKKGRKILAWVLILLGVSVLWNFASGLVYALLDVLNIPPYLWGEIVRAVPQIVFAVLMIYAGVQLIRGKKKELERELSEGDDTHDA